MNISVLQDYYNGRLKKKKHNPEIDNLLSAETKLFLHDVGLPNDEDLGFDFNDEMTISDSGLIRLEFIRPNPLCININKNEAIYSGESDDYFINSSIEQFVSCMYEFEVFYKDIIGNEVFGKYNEKKDGKPNRWLYLSYIEKKFRNIDKQVFEKGYYWPAFLEDMGFDR